MSRFPFSFPLEILLFVFIVLIMCTPLGPRLTGIIMPNLYF